MLGLSFIAVTSSERPSQVAAGAVTYASATMSRMLLSKTMIMGEQCETGQNLTVYDYNNICPTLDRF